MHSKQVKETATYENPHQIAQGLDTIVVNAASFVAEDFELLRHSNQLHLVEGEAPLFPDVEIIVSEGHTPGQQLLRFRSKAAKVGGSWARVPGAMTTSERAPPLAMAVAVVTVGPQLS